MESSGRQLSKNTKYAIVHALLGKKVRYQPVLNIEFETYCFSTGISIFKAHYNLMCKIWPKKVAEYPNKHFACLLSSWQKTQHNRRISDVDSWKDSSKWKLA